MGKPTGTKYRYRVALLAAAVILVLSGGAAGAQEGGAADGAYVGGTSIVNNSVEPSEIVESDTLGADAVGSVTAVGSREQSLAFTGSDVAGMALLAALAVILGIVLLTRRRQTSEAT